jgi:hypothetical protein
MRQNDIEVAAVHSRFFLVGLAFMTHADFHELEIIERVFLEI